MSYEKKRNRLLFGFAALMLCGVGDWLIGYEPQGGVPIAFGVTNSNIAQVPLWFFFVSMLFGILSAFGCVAFSGVMTGYLEKRAGRYPRMLSAFKFAMKSAPLMFIGFHVACCVALMYMSALMKIVAALMMAAGLSRYVFLTACGESWGWGLMCLPFLAAIKKEQKM